MKTLLLATDACIEVIRGNPGPLEAHPDAQFLISTITRFEVQSGLRERRSRKLEARARAFLEAAGTVEFDAEAADAAATVRIDLERRGEPIGAYDLLLAGQALALGIALLTGNEREFGRVRGLKVAGWR